MKKTIFLIAGLIIMLLGVILAALAVGNIYDLAVGDIIKTESEEFVYHIGYLIGSTVILFFAMGITLLGYWLFRRGVKNGAAKSARPAYEACRVIKAYRSAYPNPLKLKKNDRIRTGEKESEWPGWIWCTDQKNISGWVPESYIQMDGNDAVMLYDYDATELTVNPGDELLIINEEVGWYWCLDQTGDCGWVPKENVKINH
ncbi:MAG: SH3 domain-containing protein [Candidatus Zixiibacteriota bacterium]